MLRVVTGPFHPDLEDAVVAEVRRVKAADPLTPLTIVVPSDPLRRRLRWLLCVEHRCALLQVHFLTFYQLAVRLLEEAGVFDPARVHPEFFFQELVHQLLRRGTAASTRWSHLAEMPGAWAALLATLRDLKDARVDPERAAEGLSQSQVGLSAGVQALLSLSRAFLDEKERMQVLDQDDLAAAAEPYAAASAFLARQQQVLYYGFYDLTQVQLDLFRAVSRIAPTTLFFPLVKGHTAYGFAERFFERHLYGLMGPSSDRGSHGESDDGAARSPASPRCAGSFRPGVSCRIVSASGPSDEATFVAKDILSLVEERGYAFHEIGVVARTLTGYVGLLPRIFEQHAIPVASTLARPLSEYPLIKALIQLVGLRTNNYRRDQVIALLGSPFLRLTDPTSAGSAPRSAPRLDRWDVATRRLGITKGLEEWQRLTTYADTGLPLRDDEDDDTSTGPRIPAGDIKALWDVVSALAAALGRWPDSATWDVYTDELHAVADRWLDPCAGEAAVPADRSAELVAALRDAQEELRRLSAITPEVTLADFTAAFHTLMEQSQLPLGSARANGVQVFDAMAARGVPFRALYILGLNEKVFPRHIHEDAFLRDPVRRVLEVDLGFKIQEKLTGYEEETLLFALLCSSAREHLTVLYQRADETGRPLLPSSYLSELHREAGGGELAVPRRVTSKFQECAQYHPDRLTPSECVLKSLLDRRVPRDLLETCHPSGHLVERGVTALHSLEGGGHRLGDYDGMTGTLEVSWRALITSGVSPSALQEYATCPFRYFAKQVLRLRPLMVPESIDQLGPLELGTLAHAILRRCFEALRAHGYFAGRSPAVDPMAVLDEAARREYERFAETHPVGYPLVWRLQRARLSAFLREVLREDLEEMAQGGWEPVFFEEDGTGRLVVSLAPDLPEEIPVTGRLDRVDWSPARNAYRIIDYKFKGSRRPDSLDRNLKIGAVRATRLQPPLYLTMGETLEAALPGASSGSTCEGVWFYYLAPQWDRPLTRVPFPGDAWRSELAAPMMQALTHVLSGIRAGKFFIYASGSCEQCDYRLLCRKTHQPTLWRGRMDHAVVSPYRILRSAVPPKPGAGESAPQPDQPDRMA
ncbi:PD-(D/E)XK nuclease family protein [Candidatus Nitrospira bockiana]